MITNQLSYLPVVIAALQTLYGMIAGGRTVWTACIKVTAALTQSRYGYKREQEWEESTVSVH